MKLIKFFMLLSIVLLSGCTVGRYVTNVSLNGQNGFAVEKCTTKKWDMFFWNTECSTTNVDVIPGK